MEVRPSSAVYSNSIHTELCPGWFIWNKEQKGNSYLLPDGVCCSILLGSLTSTHLLKTKLYGGEVAQ